MKEVLNLQIHVEPGPGIQAAIDSIIMHLLLFGIHYLFFKKVSFASFKREVLLLRVAFDV